MSGRRVWLGLAITASGAAIGHAAAGAQGVPPYDTDLIDHPAATAPPPALPGAPSPATAEPAAAPLVAAPVAPAIPPHPDTVPGILDAARQLAASGQLPAASQLVEEAETRLLDRSVEVGTNDQPIETPMIQALAAARRALDGGDQAQGVQHLNDAIAHLPPIEPAQ